jgi:ABC-type multidrug transport system fused ATPase/permease subunit
MDDPLSSVDSKTEEHILSSLKAHRCYKTLILVSHRISVLKISDVVYVLDDGAIVQQGSHNDLIGQKGLYAKLARTQQMEMELEEF